MIKRGRTFRDVVTTFSDVAGGRRALRLGGLTALVTVGLIAAAGSTAWAGQEGADNQPSGYTVSVQVSYRGDARPAAGGSLTVKAACWWSPAAGNYTDAAAMLKWYKMVTRGDQSPGMIARYGPIQIWQDAAQETKAGHPMYWYMAYCVDAADYPKLHLGSVSIANPINGQTFQYYDYRAFPGGGPAPAPLVNPADLAQSARNAMDTPEPATARNPRIAAAGAPTLVGLPTWFWVTQPAAVGGASGTRTIRAQIAGSTIWAQVVARTGGLLISSPVGSADCSPAQARTAYAKGVAQSHACTVSFAEASVQDQAGWPVVVSTDWAATWTGSGGTAGTLDGLHREADIDVPVAEVQNVVTQ